MKLDMKIVTWFDLRVLWGPFSWVGFWKDEKKGKKRGGEWDLLGCLVGWIYGRKIGGLGVFSLDPPKYSLQIGKKTWMPTKDQFCPSSLCMCVEQLELCFLFSFFLFSFFFNILRLIKQLLFLKKSFLINGKGSWWLSLLHFFLRHL